MCASLIVRAISRPLLVTDPGTMWRIGLVGSGMGELAALGIVLALLTFTALQGSLPATP